jgi:hypothetical protein
MKHATNTVEDGAIGTFSHAVVLWGVGGSNLTGDSLRTEVCVSSVVYELPAAVCAYHGQLLTRGHLRPSLVVTEMGQHLLSSFVIDEIDCDVTAVIIDEGEDIPASTQRRDVDGATDVRVDELKTTVGSVHSCAGHGHAMGLACVAGVTGQLAGRGL